MTGLELIYIVIGCVLGVVFYQGLVFLVSSERRAGFKWWMLHRLDPWFEERASLDVAWRVFAQKHNAGGKRPICAYKGWEAELDEDEKAAVYEFPGGDPDALLNCLNEGRGPADIVGLLDAALKKESPKYVAALRKAFDSKKVKGTDDADV